MRAILFCFVFCISYLYLNAQPGTLDRSFGTNGKTYTAYPKEQLEVAVSVVQSDDKIIVAGNYYSKGKDGFFIMRFLSKGNLDADFGDSGKALIKFNYFLKVRDAAIQPNGKIIVTGYGRPNNESGTYDMITIRLTKEGKLDSSFGSNGKLITDFGTDEYSNGVCVQQDGKIILAGVYNGVECLLVRCKANGELDSTFGNNGKVISAVSFITGYRSVAVQSNKKIIAGGSSGNPNSIFLIGCYKPNGAIDSSFGSSGFIQTQCSNDGDNLEKLILQKDGKIIAAGRTDLNGLNDTLKDMIAVRYKNNGALDKTFGKAGIATISLQNFYMEAYSAVLQADGKLILAGDGGKSNDHPDYCIARLTINGQPDSSFANNGIIFTNIKKSDVAFGAGIQSNGDIIAAGNSFTNNINITGISLVAYKQDSENLNNNFIQSNINIYPNPAKNILHIEGLSSTQKTNLSVADLSGNIKLQSESITGSYSLNIASLKTGNYLLKIETGDNAVTKKFMKE